MTNLIAVEISWKLVSKLYWKISSFEDFDRLRKTRAPCLLLGDVLHKRYAKRFAPSRMVISFQGLYPCLRPRYCLSDHRATLGLSGRGRIGRMHPGFHSLPAHSRACQSNYATVAGAGMDTAKENTLTGPVNFDSYSIQTSSL